MRLGGCRPTPEFPSGVWCLREEARRLCAIGHDDDLREPEVVRRMAREKSVRAVRDDVRDLYEVALARIANDLIFEDTAGREFERAMRLAVVERPRRGRPVDDHHPPALLVR